MCCQACYLDILAHKLIVPLTFFYPRIQGLTNLQNQNKPTWAWSSTNRKCDGGQFFSMHVILQTCLNPTNLSDVVSWGPTFSKNLSLVAELGFLLLLVKPADHPEAILPNSQYSQMVILHLRQLWDPASRRAAKTLVVKKCGQQPSKTGQCHQLLLLLSVSLSYPYWIAAVFALAALWSKFGWSYCGQEGANKCGKRWNRSTRPTRT